jgi:hypothetical protein
MQAISKGAVFDRTKSACGRILDHGVDILAKVLSFQELPKKSASENTSRGIGTGFLHRMSMRVLLA